MATKNFSVTNYQTLKEVFEPLRLERREKRKINVKKIEKNCTLCQKDVEFKMLKC